jgi:hypothetical protein
MILSTNRSRFILLILSLPIIWTGCRDELTGEDRNRAPETYLVGAPRFNEAGYYINHLFWSGFDPDGRVDYFEVTLTDSAGNLDEAVWHRTYRADSLVRFPVGGETGTAQVLHNRFYVRAVDDRGRVDPEPAWVLFLAKDFKQPGVVFEEARGYRAGWPDIDLRDQDGDGVFNPGNGPIFGAPPRCESGFPPDTLPLGANVTFDWQGVDDDSLLGVPVGSVSSYEYILVDENNTWQGGTIADTTATYEGLDVGTYTFFVRPIDDAGWAGEACRYFHVNYDPSVSIEPVSDGSGGLIKTYRIGQFSVMSAECGQPADLAAWDYTSTGLPDPPVTPGMPDGFVHPDSVLGVVSLDSKWWVEVDVVAEDPETVVECIEINLQEGRVPFTPWGPPGEEQPEGEPSFSAQTWKAAALDENGSTVYIGPLPSGDFRVVIAAVDDAGQRGTSAADTLYVSIDKDPVLRLDKPGLPLGGLDCIGGVFGDTLQIADNDTLYVVDLIQGAGGSSTTTPCPVATRYADTGDPAPLDVFDFEPFPKPGEEIDLAFEPLPEFPGSKAATLCAVYFAEDLDGDRWVTHARWRVDIPPSFTAAWEPIIDPVRPANPGELTPFCFDVEIVQDVDVDEAEHVLYLEIRDWHRQAIPGNPLVAQRTKRYAIPFTTTDITEARYTLAGRENR